METTEILLAPRDAAAYLEVAPSTLRRLATVYESVYGPNSLGWSDGGRGGGARLWPRVALERTRAARALVEAGRASSFEVALRTLKDAPEGLALVEPPPPSADAVAELRSMVESLQKELADLRGEVSELRALPAPATPERSPEPSTAAPPEGQAAPERSAERSPGGALVRAAARLEQMWQRVTGRT